MLTYLQGTTRSDIHMATHQTARFSIDSKLSYERAVHRISRHLKGKNKKGFIFRPKKVKGLEYYVDANFAGGWDKDDTFNLEVVMSRTGYMIKNANCPVLW